MRVLQWGKLVNREVMVVGKEGWVKSASKMEMGASARRFLA